MAIQDGGFAPYAPAATVLAVIEQYRDRGSPSPITVESLGRISIGESIGARVIAALRALDLIDKEGKPLEAFEVLRRAPSDKYKESFGQMLRAAYAEVFNLTDPSKDEIERVRDAFRGYTPEPQRERMAMLFLGLCRHAGIIVKAETNAPREAGSERKPRPKLKPKPIARGQVEKKGKGDDGQNGEIPPAFTGLLRALPLAKGKWTQKRKDKFLTAFTAFLDMTIEVVEEDELDDEVEKGDSVEVT